MCPTCLRNNNPVARRQLTLSSEACDGYTVLYNLNMAYIIHQCHPRRSQFLWSDCEAVLLYRPGLGWAELPLLVQFRRSLRCQECSDLSSEDDKNDSRTDDRGPTLQLDHKASLCPSTMGQTILLPSVVSHVYTNHAKQAPAMRLSTSTNSA